MDLANYLSAAAKRRQWPTHRMQQVLQLFATRNKSSPDDGDGENIVIPSGMSKLPLRDVLAAASLPLTSGSPSESAIRPSGLLEEDVATNALERQPNSTPNFNLPVTAAAEAVRYTRSNTGDLSEHGDALTRVASNCSTPTKGVSSPRRPWPADGVNAPGAPDGQRVLSTSGNLKPFYRVSNDLQPTRPSMDGLALPTARRRSVVLVSENGTLPAQGGVGSRPSQPTVESRNLIPVSPSSAEGRVHRFPNFKSPQKGTPLPSRSPSSVSDCGIGTSPHHSSNPSETLCLDSCESNSDRGSTILRSCPDACRSPPSKLNTTSGQQVRRKLMQAATGVTPSDSVGVPGSSMLPHNSHLVKSDSDVTINWSQTSTMSPAATVKAPVARRLSRVDILRGTASQLRAVASDASELMAVLREQDREWQGSPEPQQGAPGQHDNNNTGLHRLLNNVRQERTRRGGEVMLSPTQPTSSAAGRSPGRVRASMTFYSRSPTHSGACSESPTKSPSLCDRPQSYSGAAYKQSPTKIGPPSASGS